MVYASPVPPETARWLNLLRASPSFVLVEGRTAGHERLHQPLRVPANSGMCWVSGTVTTASEQSFDAVHVVSTDEGGQLAETYVWADAWFRAEELPTMLSLAHDAVFPFRYTFAVPLEGDHYSQ